MPDMPQKIGEPKGTTRSKGDRHPFLGGLLFFFLFSLLSLTIAGCASHQVRPPRVYFPPPPDAARAVHLISFNSLGELIPPAASWVDLFRGAAPSPRVVTPIGITWRDGILYICDTTARCVHAWNLQTGESRRVGSDGALAKPVAVAVDGSAIVYVADTNRGEVVAFDAEGREILQFKPTNRNAYRPVAVAVADAELFVADLAGHRIDVYSTQSGRLMRSLGQPGSGPAGFYYPSGIALASSKRLFVADMMNARVQILEPDGTFVRSIGRPGNHYGDLGKPKALALAPTGEVLVADAEFGVVHLFDEQGRLLLVLGGPHDLPGGTPLPSGLAIAKVVPERLQKLLPPGFQAHYYLFVCNGTGRKRLALFAVGKAGHTQP